MSAIKFYFDNAAMPMMKSQILKYVDFTKTKSRYLENETLFFLEIKKIHQLHIKGYFMAKKCFVVEVTFNLVLTNHKSAITCQKKQLGLTYF